MRAQTLPYTVSLDPDTAKHLAVNGATLLFLGVPSGTLVGIDHQVFHVGPNFKGVKMLPPGVHLVSHQAISGNQQAPPISFFIILQPCQVLVRRWDAAAEALVTLSDEDEEARYAAGARRFDFDAGLAPYDLQRYGQWQRLCCFITPALVERLMPASGEISVMAEAHDPDLQHPVTAAEKRLVQQLQAGRESLAGQQDQQASPPTQLAADIGSADGGDQNHGALGPGSQSVAAAVSGSRWGRCHYTPLPRLVKVPGMTGQQLTALNMDKSALLEQLVPQAFGGSPEALLGEMQFAFAAFLCGQSLEGFLQWKAMLSLLLDCEDAPLNGWTQLFVKLLAVLQAQLQLGLGVGVDGTAVAMGAPMVEELLPDSFLRRMLARFLGILHEAGPQVPATLAVQAGELELFLRSSLGWDFRLQLEGMESDDDADGPVVVELPDSCDDPVAGA